MTAKEFNKLFGETVKWVNVHKEFEEVAVHVRYVVDGYADENPYYAEVEVYREDNEVEKFQKLFFESESPAKAHVASKEVAEMFESKVGTDNVKWVKEVIK